MPFYHPAGASWKKQGPDGDPWLCQAYALPVIMFFYGLVEHMVSRPDRLAVTFQDFLKRYIM